MPLPTVWVPSGPGVKDHRATDAGRGRQIDLWALEQSIDRGYAVASFYCGDVDPDRPDVREGIQPHFRKKGEKPGPHDWGTIAAWAWGLQRALIICARTRTSIRITSRSSAIRGSARRRSVAGAFDERIALVIPLQAGCGGTSPSRRQNRRDGQGHQSTLPALV